MATVLFWVLHSWNFMKKIKLHSEEVHTKETGTKEGQTVSYKHVKDSMMLHKFQMIHIFKFPLLVSLLVSLQQADHFHLLSVSSLAMSLATHVFIALAVCCCCWLRLLHFPLLTAITSLEMQSPCSPQATSITGKQQ